MALGAGPPRAGARARLASWRLAGSVALFAGSASVVLWQGRRVAALHDLSYVLNTAYRIAAGDVPYRDFIQPHAPLTFLVQATILKLFDSSYRHHLYYAALLSGLGTLLALALVERLLRPFERARAYAFVACLPLVPLGLHSLFPHPWYDADASFLALLAVYALVRADEEASHRLWALAAGLLVVVPVFAKQNVGLALLAAGPLAALSWLRRPDRRSRGLLLLAGAGAALLVSLALVQLACGVESYARWTLAHAARRRLAVGLAFGDYRRPEVLLWGALGGCGLALLASGAASRRRAWLGTALLAAPLLAPLLYGSWDQQFRRLWPLTLLVASATAALRWSRDRDAGAALLTLTLVALCHGAFLSQGVGGSNFALWPFYSVLVAGILVGLRRLAPGLAPRPSEAYLAAAVAAALLTGVPQLAENRRLDYLRHAGPVQASHHPRLDGLHASGPYLPRLDELLDFLEKSVPPHEGLTAIPGEDPLYFALRRRPPLPLVQFDRTVNPWDSEQLLARAREARVEWLVVKRGRQLRRQPQNRFARTLARARAEYAPVLENDVYTVLRRRR